MTQQPKHKGVNCITPEPRGLSAYLPQLSSKFGNCHSPRAWRRVANLAALQPQQHRTKKETRKRFEGELWRHPWEPIAAATSTPSSLQPQNFLHTIYTGEFVGYLVSILPTICIRDNFWPTCDANFKAWDIIHLICYAYFGPASFFKKEFKDSGHLRHSNVAAM